MPKKDEIFLGKAGKIFGPYTQNEIDQISKNGQLLNYMWIWDWKMSSWKPIESPPPSPVAAENTQNQSRNWKSIQALCRDQAHVLSGTLDQVTETGCTFISGNPMVEPKFSTAGIQHLDLYDPLQQEATQTQVRIVSIERNNHHWNYRLRWSQTPSFSSLGKSKKAS